MMIANSEDRFSRLEAHNYNVGYKKTALYNVVLKTPLEQCISEPVFYDDYLYKLKKGHWEVFLFLINLK